MQKIPVLHTVSQAYGFAFGRYFSTLSIVWLPWLGLIVLAYFLVLPNIGPIFALFAQIIQHPEDTAANQPLIMEMNRHSAYLQLFNLVELVVSVMILSGITKEALGTRTGSRFYYLQFGNAELQVLVALILMVVILIGVMIACLLGGIVIGMVGAILSAAVPGTTGGRVFVGIFAFIAFVAAFVASFYVLARSLFLLVPASVAENTIAVSRSWQLARGNIWRIFGIGVLVVLPLAIIELVIVSIFVIPLAMQLVQEGQSGGQEAVRHHVAQLMLAMPSFLVWFLPLGLLLTPIFYGLFVSAPVFAYRALVPAAPAAHS
jgi:hypothetical protein